MELDEGKDSLGSRTHYDAGDKAKRSPECRRHSGGVAVEIELELTLWFHSGRMRGKEGDGEVGR